MSDLGTNEVFLQGFHKLFEAYPPLILGVIAFIGILLGGLAIIFIWQGIKVYVLHIKGDKLIENIREEQRKLQDTYKEMALELTSLQKNTEKEIRSLIDTHQKEVFELKQIIFERNSEILDLKKTILKPNH